MGDSYLLVLNIHNALKVKSWHDYMVKNVNAVIACMYKIIVNIWGNGGKIAVFPHFELLCHAHDITYKLRGGSMLLRIVNEIRVKTQVARKLRCSQRKRFSEYSKRYFKIMHTFMGGYPLVYS